MPLKMGQQRTVEVMVERKASVKGRDYLDQEDRARGEASYAALNVEIHAHM